MQVIKRDGRIENFVMGKVQTRIETLANGLNTDYVDPTRVALQVMSGAYDGISTSEMDTLAAEASAAMASEHHEYALLAGRLVASDIQKTAPSTFSGAMDVLYMNTSEIGADPLVSAEAYRVSQTYADELNNMIVEDNDMTYDYFAIRTLQRAYLLKSGGLTIETPQYMIMRVAIGLHGDDLENIERTYNMMTEKLFTHATPTLFNAGTPKPQMISCLTGEVSDDSMSGIYKTLHDVAMLSKHGAGIGVATDKVRSSGSVIRGGGTSDGIIPMLRVFNATARYSNQLGKRKGSFAMYLNPTHPDTMKFLELKKNTGNEEERTRDLFLAMWCPDVFFERVISNGQWTFFDPNEHKELYNLYGEEFTAMYTELESNGEGKGSIPAREVWARVIESQIETGGPYMLSRDNINKYNMQDNMGNIKTSNLCSEICLYTAPDEWGNCVLSSIAVNKFVMNGKYDFHKLHQVVRQIVINLNRAIDKNFYAIPEAEKGALMQRALGIGVQGLADLAAILKMDFDSESFNVLQATIMENIYYAAIDASADLAKEEGPYPRFEGSPWSKGELHVDGWDVALSLDWEPLRKKVMEVGIRNSLLTALMPTASTSQILGNNEMFEPITSNLYARRTLSGEFVVTNKYLINDLVDAGLWNDVIRQAIVSNNGSIQNIELIPKEIRNRYKTVWEIDPEQLVYMAANRAPFVDQSQSMNLYFETPNFNRISKVLVYGWKKGLKTLSYYVRTKPASQAKKFTVQKPRAELKVDVEAVACSLDNPEACESCSG